MVALRWMVRLSAIAALGGALACGSADPESAETGSEEGGASTAEDTGGPPAGSGSSAQPGSDEDTGSPPPATGDGEDTVGVDDEGSDSGPVPAACEVTSLFEPGVHSGITIDVDGTERRYDLFVPTVYDAAAEGPLVLNFHGLFGSPSQQAGFSEFNGAAEDHGMLVAYPEGIGQSFNGGVCCGEASSSGVDDVAFARAIVEDVSAKMCVDASRVYATGMSNGGHMAHRLACEAADVFAAAASVTGVLSLAGPCTPSRPISMVQFHGTTDNIVGYAPVPAMMEAWAARNGCSAVSETTFDQGDMHCETWPGCDAGVEVSFCTIDGGGHCWPGNGDCLFGHSSTELHASEVIATLFDAQTLP
jgi:polyhydroxybutyrate depolymerase